MSILTDRSGNGVQGRLLVEDGLAPGSTIGQRRIVDLSGNANDAANPGILRYEVPGSGPTANARYMRLFINNTLDANFCSIAEVEVYDSNNVLITGGTPTASSQFDGTTTPAQARDGNTTTWWATASGAKSPCWYAIDFGSVRSFGSVRLVPVSGFPTHMPSSFAIQVSDDGILWSDLSLYTPTWVDNVPQTFAFAA